MLERYVIRKIFDQDVIIDQTLYQYHGSTTWEYSKAERDTDG